MRILSFLLVLLMASSVAAQQTYLAENGSRPEDTHGQSRLLHYLPDDMPIAVFVPQPPPPAGKELRDQVIAAFRAWQQAAPDLIAFRFLGAPEEGALLVVWQPFEDDRVGSYQYAFTVDTDGVYRFRATEILLDPRHDPDNAFRYALLEVGHALGLLGRSPFAGDAMSAEPSGQVSERDVATLRALYAVPSGTPLEQ